MATRRRINTKVAEGASGATDIGELAELFKQLKKDRGDEVVVQANSRKQPARLATGVFAIDMSLWGGLPRGRQHMLSGPSSSGKTTALLRLVKNFQQNFPDEVAVIMDVEHTIDSTWAEIIGVDTERLYLVQPDTAEAAVDYMEAFSATKEVGLIGMDSVAALVPSKEAESSADDSAVPGLHAKLITGMVRKVNRVLLIESKRKHYPTIVYLNQQRDKIGGWAPGGATPMSLPGGRALPFFCSVHLSFRNHEKMSRDTDTGADMTEFNEHSFRVEKNKVNAGIRRGEYQMMRVDSDKFENLQMGMIDDAPTMLATAKRMGLYTGGGRSWTLQLPGREVKAGKADEFIEMLYDDHEMFNELYWSMIAAHTARQKAPEEFVQHLLTKMRVWL